eukprot:3577-Heterococcus_DN1.PRE.1
MSLSDYCAHTRLYCNDIHAASVTSSSDKQQQAAAKAVGSKQLHFRVLKGQCQPVHSSLLKPLRLQRRRQVFVVVVKTLDACAYSHAAAAAAVPVAAVVVAVVAAVVAARCCCQSQEELPLQEQLQCLKHSSITAVSLLLCCTAQRAQ